MPVEGVFDERAILKLTRDDGRARCSRDQIESVLRASVLPHRTVQRPFYERGTLFKQNK
jgi:hypothetical protein